MWKLVIKNRRLTESEVENFLAQFLTWYRVAQKYGVTILPISANKYEQKLICLSFFFLSLLCFSLGNFFFFSFYIFPSSSFVLRVQVSIKYRNLVFIACISVWLIECAVEIHGKDLTSNSLTARFYCSSQNCK